MLMRACLWLFATLLIAAGNGSVLADVVVMQNGDRFTGEVNRIWGNDLSIEPDYADEFVVELDKVAYVESDRDFDLTLDDGREVTARLQGAGADGTQTVVYDGVTREVLITELEQVVEVDDGFDWESHIDWNSTATTGNTDSTVARLAADSTIEIGDHRHIATLLIADEDSAGVKTKDQDYVTYTYNWLFSDKWFLGAGASYETDPIKQLDRRTILGTGLGRDIWNFHDRSMSFEMGLGSLDESLAGVSETSTIAYWKYRFSYEFSGLDLEAYHNHQIYSYLSGRDNLFAKSSTGIRYEVGDDLFYLTMSLNVDYERDPPPGVQTEDSTWVIGAGFEF
jgi:putative salt-induced outer membrane protein YdiY